MTLIQKILKEVEASLLKVVNKEIESERYLKQNILGCRWRAFWGLLATFKDCFSTIVNIITIAIAEHRQEAHGEDMEKVIKSASRSLTTEQATASDNFWN